MSQEKIIIREYKPDDVQDLANIYYNTIHKINIRDYSEEQVNVWAPETSREIEGWAKKFEITKPFVAVINGQIVGFTEFLPTGYIDCFYCHHDWIGFGVGSALMNKIHESASERGINHLFVDVSITAKPFFEKQGFITVLEQTVVCKNVQLTNYKMEKFLRE